MSPLYGEPSDENGGRPPNFVAQMSAFPVLERPAPPLEDAQNPKKQCNEVLSDGEFHVGERVATEVDVGLSDRGLRVQKQVAPRSSHSLSDNSSFCDEEVEETCSKSVQHPEDAPTQHSDKPPTPVGPSVEQSYGPWMVVDNSRHK
ncbi:hypothetical protein V6N13_057039 [Hibiscus sabdariffa]|uniref:Uncharacterized protein n=1 Tax=Hibiscus sabdariffa TaxID=183260 RepID=A0ABR2D2S2_9ROSI